MAFGDPIPEVVQESPQLNKATRILAVFYLALPFLLIYLLFKLFPPNPWPPSDRMVQIFFVFKQLNIWTTLEERLLLLVIVAGALGSYIHAATSYSDYRGNRQFSHSWLLWYLLRPFVGVCLALIVYFAVRGGLLSMVLGGAEANDATNINPFGIAAIAGLTGMFSKQAADKLAEVFSTLFKSGGDDARKDSLTDTTVIMSIDPPEGPTEGGTKIVITGTGFGSQAKVLIGGKPAVKVEIVNGSTIKLESPPGDEGAVDVEVQNADGKQHTKVGGFTYVGGTRNGASNDTTNTDAAANASSTIDEGESDEFGPEAAEGESNESGPAKPG